jgi:hypothetical protein
LTLQSRSDAVPTSICLDLYEYGLEPEEREFSPQALRLSTSTSASELSVVVVRNGTSSKSIATMSLGSLSLGVRKHYLRNSQHFVVPPARW